MAVIYATSEAFTITANAALISKNIVCPTEVITITGTRAAIAGRVLTTPAALVVTGTPATVNASRKVVNVFSPAFEIHASSAVLLGLEYPVSNFTLGDSYNLVLNQLSTGNFTVASSVIEAGIYANVTETVKFNESMTIGVTTSLTETVVFDDQATFTHTGYLTESFTVSSSMTDSRELLVAETVKFNDSVVSTASTTSELVTSTAQFADEVVRAELSIALTSSLVVTGVVVSLETSELAVSNVTFQDVVAAAWRVNTTSVTETVRWAGDPVAAPAAYTELVTDTFQVSDAIWAKDYNALAWVLNTETGGLSQYSNFGFDSLAEYNGVLYATSPDGIYEVNSETDDGRLVAARYRTGFLDFDQEEKKHLSSVYVGYTGGDLECSVETYNSGENSVYTYPIELRDAVAPRNSRLRIGKGLNSRYWRFTLSNVSGADFQIHDLAVEASTSRRRL